MSARLTTHRTDSGHPRPARPRPPVARNECQAVGLGRGRQQRVDHRHWTDRVHLAPLLRHGRVDGQDPAAETGNHGAEPRLGSQPDNPQPDEVYFNADGKQLAG